MIVNIHRIGRQSKARIAVALPVTQQPRPDLYRACQSIPACGPSSLGRRIKDFPASSTPRMRDFQSRIHHDSAITKSRLPLRPGARRDRTPRARPATGTAAQSHAARAFCSAFQETQAFGCAAVVFTVATCVGMAEKRQERGSRCEVLALSLFRVVP